MRRAFLALAVAVLVPLASAHADALTQTIPISQSLRDFTPFDIIAAPFDPATGILEAVNLEIVGTVSPRTASDNGPFPATATLATRLFVFPSNGGPERFDRSLGGAPVPVVFTDPAGAGLSSVAPFAVDRTFGFTDLAAFVSALAGPTALVEYGFRTSTTIAGAGSDLTSFTGSAVLTYTFGTTTAVPEPAAALLFATGLLGLAWTRRAG